VFSFIGCDIGRLIINEYDEKSLFLMLLKCYEHLHQIFGALDNSQSSQMDIDAKCSLDIFEMGSCGEPVQFNQECFNQELLLFQQFQVDVKETNCPLQWWNKHETMLPIVGLLA